MLEILQFWVLISSSKLPSAPFFKCEEPRVKCVCFFVCFTWPYLRWSLECNCVHLFRCGWPTWSTPGSTRALCMPVPLASVPTCVSAVCPVGFCTTTSESSTWRYCDPPLNFRFQCRPHKHTLMSVCSHSYNIEPLHLFNSLSSVNVAVLLCPCLASYYGESSSTQLPPTTQTLIAWMETQSVSRLASAPLSLKEKLYTQQGGNLWTTFIFGQKVGSTLACRYDSNWVAVAQEEELVVQ